MSQQSDNTVSHSRDVSPADIQALRESVGWLADTEEVWRQTLASALEVRSVYKDGKLVGIGFLVGTLRHAVLCDVCVNPAFQKHGVGQTIVGSLVEAANEWGIKYVTLTYAESSPWLAGFYAKFGFKKIDDAMQLVRE